MKNKLNCPECKHNTMIVFSFWEKVFSGKRDFCGDCMTWFPLW